MCAAGQDSPCADLYEVLRLSGSGDVAGSDRLELGATVQPTRVFRASDPRRTDGGQMQVRLTASHGGQLAWYQAYTLAADTTVLARIDLRGKDVVTYDPHGVSYLVVYGNDVDLPPGLGINDMAPLRK